MRGCLLVILAVLGCGPAVAIGEESGTTEEVESATPTVASTASSSIGQDSGAAADVDASPAEADSGASTSDATGNDDDPFDDSGALTTGINGCDAVDILFVVDDSMNMFEVRERWLEGIDAVVAAIDGAFAEQSLHVGVMVAEDFVYSLTCYRLGDLRSETYWGTCLPEGEPRFATNENLVEDLTCLLDVGDAGVPRELPVSGAVIALSEQQAAPGACNEGFLRDEAVLGIFFISNDTLDLGEDDDAHPDTDTSTWYTDLVAAKDGDMSAIVTVGLIAQSPSHCYSIYGGANENLAGLIDEFGMWGQRSSICEDDLVPALEAGVELLADTCAVWVP